VDRNVGHAVHECSVHDSQVKTVLSVIYVLQQDTISYFCIDL